MKLIYWKGIKEHLGVATHNLSTVSNIRILHTFTQQVRQNRQNRTLRQTSLTEVSVDLSKKIQPNGMEGYFHDSLLLAIRETYRNYIELINEEVTN